MGLFGKREKDPRRETLHAARLADREKMEQHPQEDQALDRAKPDIIAVEHTTPRLLAGGGDAVSAVATALLTRKAGERAAEAMHKVLKGKE